MNYLIQKQKNNPYYSKILLLGFIFLFSFFFLKNNAYADTFPVQTIYGATSTATTQIQESYNLQPDTNLSGATLAIVVHGDYFAASFNFHLQWGCDAAFVSCDVDFSLPYANNLANATQTQIGPNDYKVTFTFPTSTTSTYGYIQIYTNANGEKRIEGATINTTAGNLICVNGIATTSNCGDLKDIYISLNNAFSPPTATMMWPRNGFTTTDFNNWVVYWQNISSPLSAVGVEYGTSSNNYTFYDETSLSNDKTNQVITIPKSTVLIPQYEVTATTTWYARPYMRVGFSTTTFNEISFITDPQAPIVSDPFGSLAIRHQPYIIFPTSSPATCNGAMECTISYVIKYGFQPSDTSMGPLKKELSAIKTVFPFNIPISFFQMIEDASTTNPTTTTLLVPLTGLNSSGTITLISNTSLNDTVGTPLKDQIFSVIRAFLYISTAGSMIFTII